MFMKKVFKVAHIRELEKQVIQDKITYGRMVEIMNEMAHEAYSKVEKLPIHGVVQSNSNYNIPLISGCYWCDNPLAVGQVLEVLPDNRGIAHEKCAEEFYGSKIAED